MRISLEKNSNASSESQFFGRSSWENLTDSHAQRSSVSENLSLKMGASAHDSHNTKLLCFQLQDQDSSSTQSTTGQSDSEVVSMKGGANLYGQGLAFTQSGRDEASGKLMGGQNKHVSSMGTQEFVFAPQLDCGGQQAAHVPFHYGEPYFGGLLASASYGPQAMIHHSQLVGISPARVPLPLAHLTEDEPIYVNAKQYCAIMRRRQSRAKLEAQNKLVKARKPYLHESRHLHALKRARGSGGRFLTAKDVQRSKDDSSASQQHIPITETQSETHHHHSHHYHHNSEKNNNNNNKDRYSNTSCSEVTSGSNSDDMFHNQQEIRFSGYNPRHHVSARH